MNHPLDTLAYQAVFGVEEERQKARFEIWQQGVTNGVILSSINDLYMARGRGELPNNFSVPAMNIRAMSYDTARALFAAAKKINVSALICEIARSEMGYTNQSPQEYVSVVTAAALREGWSGALFIQGDHFQAKAAEMGKIKEGEQQKIEELIEQAVQAGFYNIDIDMSTLVDLDKPTEAEQQVPNFEHSAHFAQFIRSLEPTGITISLGAEIGHIGGKNSTKEDLVAFMDGFLTKLPSNLTGISKISVQTGTSHGGQVLSDGTLADLDVDFSILKNITQIAQEKYHFGGAVQHGASTLPDKYFNQFVKFEALEVHLATGFQNILLDHPAFPSELLQQIYAYIDEQQASERKKEQTDEQFHYKLRKKALGPFKKQLWELPEDTRATLRQALAERFSFFFKELNVIDTKAIVEKFVKPVVVDKKLADFSAN